MASSSSNPLSQVPQVLPHVLSWSPPELYPRVHPGKEMSQKTREPAFFDRHFSEKLKLLHVKRCPTLIRDLTAIVDNALLAGFTEFPLSLSPETIHTIVSQSDRGVVDEIGVASFYSGTTAIFALGVASILAFGVRDLLRWSQSANVSGYAIADGFLYFPDPADPVSADLYVQLEARLGKETVDHIRLLGNDRSSLATYEFKNLAAGRQEVIFAIPNLSNAPKFEWTNCTAPECATLAKREAERRKVVETEAKMGHDTEIPLWSLDCSPSLVVHVPGPSEVRKRKRGQADPIFEPSYDQGNHRRSRLVLQRADEKTSNPLTQAGSIPPPLPPVGVEVGSSSAFPSLKGKEKEQVERTGGHRRSSRLVLQRVANEKALKPGSMPPPGREEVPSAEYSGHIGNNDNEISDPSYKDVNDLSALYIVQQAWVQAARANCSVIVIQSGNYECIGIRHRAAQTLYISDIIQPHACTDPTYGKLHVGLYMAAVEDAIHRTRLDVAGSGNDDSGRSDAMDLKDYEGSKRPRGDDRKSGKRGGKRGRKRGRKKDGKPTGNTGGDGTMVDVAAHEIAAKTLEFASLRDVILVYLQYGVYDSPSPSTFVRSGPNGQAPVPLPSWETVRQYRLEQCLTIVLKSEIGNGLTGKVLRGTLMVDASCALLDVALKLALGNERANALRNEYTMYCRLGKSGLTAGITTPLGLFDDVQGDACALVMPYVGKSLADMPEFLLTSSHQEAILATLKEIHKADILHNDLRLDNVLVADPGQTTLIDFGGSRVCLDQDAKDREFSHFQALLVRRAKRHHGKVKCFRGGLQGLDIVGNNRDDVVVTP